MKPVGIMLLVASLSATSAQAAKEPASKPVQPYVDIQTIGLPAVVQGRLVNYIFTDIRLNIGPGVDASRIQQQEPFLRDTLVRTSGHTPFNLPGDGLRLDEARLKAAVLSEARTRFGPGKVVGVVIRSQTPQRRTGVPGSARSPGDTPKSG